MNAKNIIIISVMISTVFVSFFIGGYATLSPFLFITGLLVAYIINIWIASKMETKFLIIFVIMSTALAILDEYAHTSAGTLMYFDHAVPSPLTIFGWSIFMMVILAISSLIMKVKSFDLHKLEIQYKRIIRILPVLASLILVSIMVIVQGYASVFSLLLLLVYAILVLASCYYTYGHSLKWDISLMISSLAIGFFMEFTGAHEGLWTFHYMELVSLFIVFSWPLRVWAVLGLCSLSGADLGERSEPFEAGQVLIS